MTYRSLNDKTHIYSMYPYIAHDSTSDTPVHNNCFLSSMIFLCFQHVFEMLVYHVYFSFNFKFHHMNYVIFQHIFSIQNLYTPQPLLGSKPFSVLAIQTVLYREKMYRLYRKRNIK